MIISKFHVLSVQALFYPASLPFHTCYIIGTALKQYASLVISQLLNTNTS